METSTTPKQKITPFLWFNHQAEEAVKYYITIFKNSKINSISYYQPGSPGPAGAVMSITFELEGQHFYALNGGPLFKLTPAISFLVNCITQEEVDNLWNKLADGGQPNDCGWVTDKYGVTWQIVPTLLGEMLNDKDPAKSKRVMAAMLKMKKLDIQVLKEAYKGE